MKGICFFLLVMGAASVFGQNTPNVPTWKLLSPSLLPLNPLLTNSLLSPNPLPPNFPHRANLIKWDSVAFLRPDHMPCRVPDPVLIKRGWGKRMRNADPMVVQLPVKYRGREKP